MQKQGTVKFFNNLKGFGFITPTHTTKEIFVHISGLINDIRETDSVSYEEVDSPKGLSAVNVRLV